jgi:hypothetical protein
LAYKFGNEIIVIFGTEGMQGLVLSGHKRGSRDDRGQWQALLGSSRGQPPDRRQPGVVLAFVKDKALGGAEEARP